MHIDTLQTLGFDRSTRVTGKRTYTVRIGCSQCEPAIINGHASHEHGCPNITHECNGCTEIIPLRQHYCKDCAL